jgi:hypothetical protein
MPVIDFMAREFAFFLKKGFIILKEAIHIIKGYLQPLFPNSSYSRLY